MAVQFEADKCIIATNVAKVHSEDPRENPGAESFDRLTLDELQQIVGPPNHSDAGSSKVVDPVGVGEARENGLPQMSSMVETLEEYPLDKWGRFRRNDGDPIMASRKDTILKAAQRTAKQAHSAATQRRKKPSSRVNVDPHRHCSVCWKPISLESDPRSVEMVTALGCMKGGEVEEAFLFHHVSRYCCFRRNASSSDIHGGIRLNSGDLGVNLL